MKKEKRNLNNDEQSIPFNIEAEQSVLCAMMVDKDSVEMITEFLVADDFYREAHKVIFNSMLELHNARNPIDLNTITEKLIENGKLEDVGGLGYITSLTHAVMTAGNVKYHADIVKTKAQLRKMINVGSTIVCLGYDTNETLDSVIKKATEQILDMRSFQKNSTFANFNDVAMSIADNIANLLERKRGMLGIPSGYKKLDELTSGLQAGDYFILAARPSMGKTAFALNLVQNVAFRSHIGISERPYVVGVFSLEMSKEQLVQRMLCSEGKINSQNLRTGNMTQEEWERFWEACNLVSNANVYIDDTAGISVAEMRRRAKKLKADNGLDLIVIDYIQLMEAASTRGGGSMDRQNAIAKISREIKATARELQVPIIALSQLSREIEKREIKRPALSDLRDSGSLEQDADIVAFLYRREYYDHSIEDKTTELIIAKHRNGPLGTVWLDFDNSSTTFKEGKEPKNKNDE